MASWWLSTRLRWSWHVGGLTFNLEMHVRTVSRYACHSCVEIGTLARAPHMTRCCDSWISLHDILLTLGYISFWNFIDIITVTWYNDNTTVLRTFLIHCPLLFQADGMQSSFHSNFSSGPQYILASKLFEGPMSKNPFQAPPFVRSKHSVARGTPLSLTRCSIALEMVVCTANVSQVFISWYL